MRAFSFMRVYMSRKLKELEEQIGYTFQDPRLLRRAMMHSSYVNEKHLPKYECNERLEFLGDAVLELVSSEFLFHENEKMPEGELTKTRASMVCEQALAFCARQIRLGEYLLHKKLFYDSKTILQELVQAAFEEPVAYELTGEEGPDHDKTFHVEVHIGGDVYGAGSGRTKKAAEQEAAYRTILLLHERNIK